MKIKREKKMRKGMKIVAVLFWLLVWQIAALIWKDSIVFVGPVDMMGALIDQVGSSSFWISIARSFLCIMGGFLAAFAASCFATSSGSTHFTVFAFLP